MYSHFLISVEVSVRRVLSLLLTVLRWVSPVLAGVLSLVVAFTGLLGFFVQGVWWWALAGMVALVVVLSLAPEAE